MSIAVVGSIAFDTIKTPFGERHKALGGAANYFAVAAKFFTKVNVVGVVGRDFPENHLAYLQKSGVDISGIEILEGSSFHWHGEYGLDLNVAKTLATELNVFKNFSPMLSENYRNSSCVFLANIDPDLQLHVLDQMNGPKVRALDSMNYWISSKRVALQKAVSLVDVLFLNDCEIRELTGEYNIVKAMRACSKMGARIVVVKRGEHGSLLSCDNQIAYAPAYPLEEVFDPTGAGDTFAGGFLGALDSAAKIDEKSLKRALLMGTVMSSFVIEQFSFDRLLTLNLDEVTRRRTELQRIASLDSSDV